MSGMGMSGSSRVVVGRLQQRSWTAEGGSTRSVFEVAAEELGPNLGRDHRRGPTRILRNLDGTVHFVAPRERRRTGRVRTSAS
jgi:hypothetical protein